MKPERIAGIILVLALHAVAFYGLWSYRLIPVPDEVVTLFVETLTEPPKPTDPSPKRTEKPKPIEKPRPVEQPQQIVSHAPTVSPAEPVAPPPPPKSAPAPAPSAEAPSAPPARPAGPINLGVELSVACPERTPPVYPPAARRRGQEGTVVLRVELDEQGRVSSAQVATTSGFPQLDEAALAAVKTWRCAPPRRGDQPVRATAVQPFKFVLE